MLFSSTHTLQGNKSASLSGWKGEWSRLSSKWRFRSMGSVSSQRLRLSASCRSVPPKTSSSCLRNMVSFWDTLGSRQRSCFWTVSSKYSWRSREACPSQMWHKWSRHCQASIQLCQRVLSPNLHPEGALKRTVKLNWEALSNWFSSSTTYRDSDSAPKSTVGSRNTLSAE